MLNFALKSHSYEENNNYSVHAHVDVLHDGAAAPASIHEA